MSSPCQFIDGAFYICLYLSSNNYYSISAVTDKEIRSKNNYRFSTTSTCILFSWRVRATNYTHDSRRSLVPSGKVTVNRIGNRPEAYCCCNNNPYRIRTS